MLMLIGQNRGQSLLELSGYSKMVRLPLLMRLQRLYI